MRRIIQRIPVTLMRGGTSKGIFLNAADLPPAGASRDQLLLSLLGSPDVTGMQLNGLGGGISSTSKVVILSPFDDTLGLDVNYLFGQVSLTDPSIDWDSSCANLASAVGLYHVRMKGRYPNPNNNPNLDSNAATSLSDHYGGESDDGNGRQWVDVNVWQENLGQHLRVSVGIEEHLDSAKDFIQIPGVPGKAPPIKVAWVAPKYPGAELLPTGNAQDTLSLSHTSGVTEVPATLLCGTNPTVFVDAKSLGLTGAELPKDIPYEQLLPVIEQLRVKGAEKMGLPLVDGLRVCWVTSPSEYVSSSGEVISASDVDILARITTSGRVHHAITGTGAANLSIAAAIPGTVPSSVKREQGGNTSRLHIGHPGGVMPAEAEVELVDGNYAVKAVGFYRTAKWLMHGIAEVELQA